MRRSLDHLLRLGASASLVAMIGVACGTGGATGSETAAPAAAIDEMAVASSGFEDLPDDLVDDLPDGVVDRPVSATVEDAEAAAPLPGVGESSFDALIDGALTGLGELGYHGACPTIESTGLDPLSLEAFDAVAAQTAGRHCSWLMSEGTGARTINLERPDVLDDEGVLYAAVIESDGIWRFATVAERDEMRPAGIIGEVLWLGDLVGRS